MASYAERSHHSYLIGGSFIYIFSIKALSHNLDETPVLPLRSDSASVVSPVALRLLSRFQSIAGQVDVGQPLKRRRPPVANLGSLAPVGG